MSSEVKANKLSPATGTALQISDSGDTTTIPSGATLDVSSATMTGFTIPSGQTLTVASGGTITNSGTATGFGGDNTPSFRAYLSTNQTGTTNSAWNKVNFDTEEWDTDSAFDSSTNYRFTVPSGEDGKYHFVAEVGVAPSSGSDGATDQANVSIYKNGSAYSNGDGMIRIPVNGTGGDIYVGSTAIMNLAASDYVEVFCWHNLGTSRQFSAATSFFSGFKLVGV
jgi:hypothetical protein